MPYVITAFGDLEKPTIADSRDLIKETFFPYYLQRKGTFTFCKHHVERNILSSINESVIIAGPNKFALWRTPDCFPQLRLKGHGLKP